MRRNPKPYSVYPPRSPMSARALAVVLGLVLLAVVGLSSCSPDAKATAADRVSSMPQRTLEKQARIVARTGGIYSSRYGAASPYLKRLSRELVARAFPSWAERWAFCVVGRESGWNPGAISRTDDHGLAQINRPSHRWVDYRRITADPVYGVAVFVRLSDRGASRGPWGGGTYSC